MAEMQLRLDGGVETGTADEVIRQMAADGYRPPTIAHALNNRGLPTRSGRGRWWPATVAWRLDPQGHAAYMRDYRARRWLGER